MRDDSQYFLAIRPSSASEWRVLCESVVTWIGERIKKEMQKC
jgi:hypothetical protein